jgi:phosphoglycerate kinase
MRRRRDHAICEARSRRLFNEEELDYLGRAVGNPVRPYAAILGGSKISGKIDVIQHLMTKVDALLIGGG